MKRGAISRIACALLFGWQWGVALADMADSVHSDPENGQRCVAMRYAWLDGTRLFMMSSDEGFLSQIHADCAKHVEAHGKTTGIVVLDFDVVPPWNGTLPLGVFPAPPRPSRENPPFWLDDVAIPDGEGNLLAQDVFVFEWLKKKPDAWTPGPWLLRTEVAGWPSANLLKTLLRLPDNVDDIDHIQYKGVRVPLLEHAGDFRPASWASREWLPGELSCGGKYPAVPSSPAPRPKTATFYPREYGYAEAAVRRHPTCAEGYVLRARLECGVNDEAALRDYDQAARLAPGIPGIFAERAGLFYRNYMVFDAFLDASRAAELDPAYTRDKEYYMQAGHIEEVDGGPEEGGK